MCHSLVSCGCSHGHTVYQEVVKSNQQKKKLTPDKLVPLKAYWSSLDDLWIVQSASHDVIKQSFIVYKGIKLFFYN